MAMATEANPAAPVEGEPVTASTEEVTADEKPPVTEGEPAPVEGEKPPEGEKAAETPAEPEIPEATLKAAAEKFAAEKVKQANSAMAAARRAEARTEAVKLENRTLSTELTAHKDFVSALQAGGHRAIAALRQIGRNSVREFLDSLATGGEEAPVEPPKDPRLDALLAERQAERVEQAKRATFAAIDGMKDKYVRVATARGRRELWDEIVAYNGIHGSVPDEAIFRIADTLERDLRAEFGDPSSSPRPAVKNGASVKPPLGAGKTITNRQTASPPGSAELSMDPDIRREQVQARMRAAGEL